MRIEIRNRCSDFSSYRAARVKSLFNVETGCNFSLDAELPIEATPWKLGVIVGPSGSGKTSLGRKILGEDPYYSGSAWATDKPIIEEIAPAAEFDAVTGAFAAVGLGSVPSWLRPYHVLSNGEKFRAELARIVVEVPEKIVVDEFTSVIDRQIARIGALAFAKAWRRTSGQCVLLSCHYDILPWVQPDWVFDTGTGKFTGRYLQPRPQIPLDVWQVDGSYWPAFEPHHYLKLPRMIAATYYIGTVEGELVCHVATSPKFDIGGMRACRLVVIPEWQGAGVGTRFLDLVCQLQLEGQNKWGRKCPTYFHTSHPGLAFALRRSKKWVQVSAKLHGDNKAKSAASLRKSQARAPRASGIGAATASGDTSGRCRDSSTSERRRRRSMFESGRRGPLQVFVHGDASLPAIEVLRSVVLAGGYQIVTSTKAANVAIAPLLTTILMKTEYSAPQLGTLIVHP